MERSPEPQQIEEALYLIINTTDEIIRKQASDYLRQLEQNQPNLLLSLIFIVENSSIQFSKWQSLILIKNIIVRNWIRATIINKKKVNILSEELKSVVKSKCFNFLIVSKDQKERDAINSIIQAIAKYDFPGKFIELENYFISTLEQQSSQQFELQPQLLDFMITLNEVQKEVVKNRLMAFKVQQYQFTCKILKSFVTLWKSQTTIQQELLIKKSSNQIVNNLSSKMDRLLSNLSLSFHQEDDQQYISEIFTALLEKCAWFIKCEHEQQSQIKTLVSCLVNLQQQYPIGIGKLFYDYLSLLKYIILSTWKDQRVLKIGLIGLIQILRTYTYYCTNEQFKSIIPQPKTQMFQQLRIETQQKYYEFFNSNINIFLEALIKTNAKAAEDQEFDSNSKQNEERVTIQSPLSLLCQQFQQEIMKRFPEQVSLYLQVNIKQLISNDFSSINFDILDSFLNQMNQFIQFKGKIEDQQIPIGTILNYLLTLNTMESQQRFIQICVQYIPFSTKEEQNIILNQLIVYGNNPANQQIMIQAQKAILYFFNIKELQISNIDPEYLILACQIIISQLFQMADNYQSIFHLIEKILFQFLISFNNQSNVNEFILGTGLYLLTQTKIQLLTEAFCELIKALLLRFSLGTNQTILQTLALQTIENNIQQQPLLMLDLSLFLLMEYDERKALNEFGISLKNLISRNEQYFLQQKSSYITIQYLKLTEEFVLLNYKPFNNIFLSQLVTQSVSYGTSKINEEEMNLKEQCLSLLETVIIKNLDSIDPLTNQQILMQLVQQLITLEQSSNKSFTCQNCKNKIINIINRFLLKDGNNFLDIIISNGLTFDSYYIFWLENSQHFTNKGDKRINTAAQLLSLQHLSKECLQKVVEQTFEECLPEIFYDQELKSSDFRKQERENKLKYFNAIATRKSKNRQSYRKETLLQEYDIDLKSLFFSSLQKCMINFNIREIIHDQKILNNMNMLLDEC